VHKWAKLDRKKKPRLQPVEGTEPNLVMKRKRSGRDKEMRTDKSRKSGRLQIAKTFLPATWLD
jgi:hypothetical protein